MSDENQNCLLCGAECVKKTVLLWGCIKCDLLFKNPKDFWPLSKEKARYLTHNNDVSDRGYLDYLNKLISMVKNAGVLPLEGAALDFGSGPVEGLKALLKSQGLQKLKVDSYDPIFFPNLELNKKYNLIYASECFEHFYDPKKEIDKVVDLLKPGGFLAVGTNLSDGVDLENWWYTNDPTHVVFYSHKTMKFIAESYNMELIFSGADRLVFKLSV